MEPKQKVNILLVDDRPDKLAALAAMLEELDENLILSSSGKDALRALLQQEFAVILLDVNMPIMDGFETASLIRQRKSTSGTPIIFITAFADETHVSRGYKLGAVDYILQPVEPEVLRAKVSVFVELYRKTAQVRDQAELLRKVNQDLEDASRAKDRFLAGISHELRTPLNAVIGFTGTLLMKLPGPLTADQERQLRMIQGSAKHLLSLINDLLDLGRIDSGRLQLNFESVLCQDVVHEVANAMRPLADNKGLDLEVSVPPEPVRLHSDRRALNQILLNLANNAVKFTDHGQVTLGLRQVRENGHLRTLFSVRDTGPGIRPEDHVRLFHAFTQLDSTADRRFEGTGLGLHLSQKLASHLGGQIRVESEFGKGTVFTLDVIGL